MLGRDKKRYTMKARDIEDKKQKQEHRRNGMASALAHLRAASFSSAPSGSDQDHCEDTTATSGCESAEIPESQSQSRHDEDCRKRGCSTATPSIQGRNDLMKDISQQFEVRERNGTSSTSASLTRQLVPVQISRHTSPTTDADASNLTPQDGEVLVNISGASFLGVYGERVTGQGLEYACLVETWLRPEDGIPRQQIQEYKHEAVRSKRLQSLRKRKHDSDHDVMDRRVLQKLECWKRNTIS
ncbi:hypothetical protein LTS08_006039 [Lithohypha guttulata]|nr:hypothetical protein LTS08_006039 [Lithohypha guttulata]